MKLTIIFFFLLFIGCIKEQDVQTYTCSCLNTYLNDLGGGSFEYNDTFEITGEVLYLNLIKE